MIWPSNLVAVTLMNAMYEENTPKDPSVIGGRMPRYRWFMWVTIGAFAYYFIPGFLVKCLSVFAFVTWIAPQNVVVNQLFGGTTGLSLIPITFDWTQISGYIGSPLIPPWYDSMQTVWCVVADRILGMLLPTPWLALLYSLFLGPPCSTTQGSGMPSSFR